LPTKYVTLIIRFILLLPLIICPTSKVVGSNGSGSISYRTALTAVFFEGIIFMFLALTGMRQWLVRLIPATIKTATGVGIGFFLTEIGLSYSSGIGAITGGGGSTPLALGGCPPGMIDAESGGCNGGQMSNPTVSLRLSHFAHSPIGMAKSKREQGIDTLNSYGSASFAVAS
jgi:xanthine/uracil/vitamin C permease (AzgA family)